MKDTTTNTTTGFTNRIPNTKETIHITTTVTQTTNCKYYYISSCYNIICNKMEDYANITEPVKQTETTVIQAITQIEDGTSIKTKQVTDTGKKLITIYTEEIDKVMHMTGRMTIITLNKETNKTETHNYVIHTVVNNKWVPETTEEEK